MTSSSNDQDPGGTNTAAAVLRALPSSECEADDRVSVPSSDVISSEAAAAVTSSSIEKGNLNDNEEITGDNDELKPKIKTKTKEKLGKRSSGLFRRLKSRTTSQGKTTEDASPQRKNSGTSNLNLNFKKLRFKKSVQTVSTEAPKVKPSKSMPTLPRNRIKTSESELLENLSAKSKVKKDFPKNFAETLKAAEENKPLESLQSKELSDFSPTSREQRAASLDTTSLTYTGKGRRTSPCATTPTGRTKNFRRTSSVTPTSTPSSTRTYRRLRCSSSPLQSPLLTPTLSSKYHPTSPKRGIPWATAFDSAFLLRNRGPLLPLSFRWSRVRSYEGSGLTIRIPRHISFTDKGMPTVSTTMSPLQSKQMQSPPRTVSKSKSLTTSMDKLGTPLIRPPSKGSSSRESSFAGSRGSTPSSTRSAAVISRPPSRRSVQNIRSPRTPEKSTPETNDREGKTDSPTGSEVSVHSGHSANSAHSVPSAASSNASIKSHTSSPTRTSGRSSVGGPTRSSSEPPSGIPPSHSTPTKRFPKTGSPVPTHSVLGGVSKSSPNSTGRKTASASSLNASSGDNGINDMGDSTPRTMSRKSTPSRQTPPRTPNSGNHVTHRHSLGSLPNKKPLPVFNSYMDLFEVQERLKKGEVIEGVLRINPKNYEDAYISAPDGAMDIFIGGVHNRNGALNGDIVAIEISPHKEWKVMYDQLYAYLEENADLKGLVYNPFDDNNISNNYASTLPLLSVPANNSTVPEPVNCSSRIANSESPEEESYKSLCDTDSLNAKNASVSLNVNMPIDNTITHEPIIDTTKDIEVGVHYCLKENEDVVEKVTDTQEETDDVVVEKVTDTQEETEDVVEKVTDNQEETEDVVVEKVTDNQENEDDVVQKVTDTQEENEDVVVQKVTDNQENEDVVVEKVTDNQENEDVAIEKVTDTQENEKEELIENGLEEYYESGDKCPKRKQAECSAQGKCSNNKLGESEQIDHPKGDVKPKKKTRRGHRGKKKDKGKNTVAENCESAKDGEGKISPGPECHNSVSESVNSNIPSNFALHSKTNVSTHRRMIKKVKPVIGPPDQLSECELSDDDNDSIRSLPSPDDRVNLLTKHFDDMNVLPHTTEGQQNLGIHLEEYRKVENKTEQKLNHLPEIGKKIKEYGKLENKTEQNLNHLPEIEKKFVENAEEQMKDKVSSKKIKKSKKLKKKLIDQCTDSKTKVEIIKCEADGRSFDNKLETTTDSPSDQHKRSDRKGRTEHKASQKRATHHSCKDASNKPNVFQVMRLDNWQNFVQKTGFVVHILEKKHSRMAAGILKLFPDKNPNFALFSPFDSRVPRMKILISQCPEDFLCRDQDYAKVILLARLVVWTEPKFAFGELVQSIGNVGDVTAETIALLLENNIDYAPFPDKIANDLPAVPWRIPCEEFVRRMDLRESLIVTIDPSTARDLDDAVSCLALPSGNFRVGVHIADVTHFVKPDTLLDTIAADRATSVYLTQEVIPMLPRQLCEGLCSLNAGEDRLTLSVIWELTPEGKVEDRWFGHTIIRSCIKLNYEHAQSMIDDPDCIQHPEQFPPLSGKHSLTSVCQVVTDLHKIAGNLRRKREDGGSLRLDQPKICFSLDPYSKNPNGIFTYEHTDSHKLIEEFMLLANMAVAHKIYETFPDISLLRNHPPPHKYPMERTVQLLRKNGIHLDASTSGTLSASIKRYAGKSMKSKSRMLLIVSLCSKPMQFAQYFCTGVLNEEFRFHHYALNVPFYTHFTSPIRRYADIMVHRLLSAALLPETYPVPKLLPGDIQKKAAHCNDKKKASKLIQEASCDLFLALFIRNVGEMIESGMVIGILDKAVDVFVHRLGIVKRCYMDKLPLRSYHLNNENRCQESIDLQWKENKDKNLPSCSQKITYFTMVTLSLRPYDDGKLKFNAFLLRPDSVPEDTL